MSDNRLQKYAQLLVKLGVNVQKDQYLIIEAPVDAAPLVEACTAEAFKCQAKDVIVFYTDPYVDKERLQSLKPEEIATVPSWQQESRLYYMENGAVSLLIKSAYPYLYKDCDTSATSALQSYTNDLRNNIRLWMNKGAQWCIASYPNKVWAKTLFPNVSEEEAYSKLMDTIFTICRVDENTDPIDNWHAFMETNKKRSALIDSYHLDHLVYTNSLGTNLTVGLSPNARWGHDEDPNHIKFCPNIPTEEICSSPDKFRTEGIVYASKPLELGGAIVEDFGFEFKDGKVVSWFAKKNKELLDNLLASDEGACYLGECALVQDKSPISQSGLLFYNTLYDENASCHLALGKGFPGCIKGVDPLDLKTWEAANLNYSKIHIDFMFGTPDMSIKGYDKDGKEYIIFDKGNFVE